MDGTVLPEALGRPAHRGRFSALTHLQQLEAESIHIIREAVAQSDNPVMLYSIGKDSSVLLRLALKAFYPGKLPFPLLHIDTTWKFRDMIAFRDKVARTRSGSDCPHQREWARARHRSDQSRLRGPHRRHEDAGASAGTRQIRV
jgi:3'-phosphoadenosine 5'-phosphosulfate sulfotransferase (PAPS reductase)/FAD synthetase